MKLSPSGLLEHSRSADGRKQMRYAMISVVFLPVGQVLIQVFGQVFHNRHGEGNYTLASIISAVILTGPNFYANRRFVWKDTTKDRLRTQILVFWVAAMLGVGLATTFTFFGEEIAKGHTKLIQGICAFIAQCLGFGIVWVGRYIILDKWLFKVTHDGQEPSAEVLDELHHDFPI